jgi:mRNA interferase MazF
VNSGDVVLLHFPQTDLVTGKLRPALVLATAPGRHSDLLLAMISSRTYQAIPQFDEVIDPSDADYSETGLKTRSVIRVARLASVDVSTIDARLGNISQERLQRIRVRLIDWLQMGRIVSK